MKLQTSTVTTAGFLVLSILLTCHFAIAQSITGKVTDVNGKGLPFVNVLLMNAKDSLMVKAAVTDTIGTYFIENVHSGQYLISASFVGYKKGYLPSVFIGDGVIQDEVPRIVLSEEVTQLKEVSISGQRPFIEQLIDRTVVNVGNSIVAGGSTALEVLEKAPGVTVDRQNDLIQMRGKEGVVVQINGKQTYLASQDIVSMLKGTASDNIEKIELITNPSSKYDAAGNSGIINIVIKRNDKIGTNGMIYLAGGSGRYDRERAGFQVNHRNQKLNIFGNYGFSHSGNYFDLYTVRQLDYGSQSNVCIQQTYLRTPDVSQNAKAGIEYSISKRTTVGLVWAGLWTSGTENGAASSAFRRPEDDQIYLDAETDKTLATSLSNQLTNLNIQQKFKNKGQITADFDAGWFTRSFSNDLITTTTQDGNAQPVTLALLNDMPTTISLYTFKSDYARELGEKWKLEGGIKQSYVKTQSDLTIATGPVGNTIADPSLENDFKYTESVSAAYTNLSGKIFDHTEVQIGLRSEHTHSVANSITTGIKVSRDYINFFPSLFISHAISKKHTLSFSYGRRIDRPNYQNLNPGRSYVDPYLYFEGNPYLRPQYTHTLELKHSFKSNIFTSIGASFTDEFVSIFVQPVDSTLSVRTPSNVGRTQVYNATLSFPLTITKGWTFQVTLFGLYSRFQYMFLGESQRSEQLSARINGSNSILLGKGFSAELSGWLNSPATTALYHNPWLGSFDAGLQKSLSKKLKLRLTLQDVLHSNHRRTTIDAPGFVRSTRINFDTRILLLNLTYNFGNEKLKGASQRRTGSEDELRRTN